MDRGREQRRRQPAGRLRGATARRRSGRLLDEIARWRRHADEPVLVVADGHPTARVPEGTHDGVHLRYARSNDRDAADDVIARIVEQHDDPASLTVVTSDRALADRVTTVGAAVEGAGRFLDASRTSRARWSDRAVRRPIRHRRVAPLLGRGGEARVFALDAARVAATSRTSTAHPARSAIALGSSTTLGGGEAHSPFAALTNPRDRHGRRTGASRSSVRLAGVGRPRGTRRDDPALPADR